MKTQNLYRILESAPTATPAAGRFQHATIVVKMRAVGLDRRPGAMTEPAIHAAQMIRR